MGSFGISIEGRRVRRLLSVTIIGLATFACAQATQQTGSAPAQTPPAAAGPETAKPAAPATQKPPSRDNIQKPAAPGAAAATQKPPAPEQAKPPAKPMMATSADKTQIAYETGGAGPALILVQGAGEGRRSWQERGYAERLRKQFTVITFDRRGSGDSGKPMGVDAYSLDNVIADILAVADATGAKRFHIWGFGDGASIVRHLAAKSDRVMSAVVVGATFGPAVTGITKDAITAMRAKWLPLVEANAAGKLDLKSLSPGDRAAWENGIAISALSLGALLDFPPLEPSEIKAPTLWIVGAEDEGVRENIKTYEGKLKGTSVTLKALSSLSYSDTFIKSEILLAEVEPFLLKNKPTQ